MGVEKHAALCHNLAGQSGRIGAIAQHSSGLVTEWHKAVSHFKAGNEEFAIVQAVPLPVKISAAIDAVIAQANEIDPGSLQNTQDFFHRDHGIV